MIGQTVSHYKILEKLGEGGMGVVYKAQDTKLDRTVALKFLPHYLTTDQKEKERFYHEARAASSLNHPNVTTIHEIAEEGEEVFLAMEYVEGKTLKALVQQEDQLSLKRVLEIAIQICEGLMAAHEKGIVHRDIKSDNIMLTAKGQVKVMDFGLAKLKGASKLTRAGSTVGTAAYMSPEQAQAEEVDHRSDIFSFGVVLYELLTTKLPFRGEHQAALLYSLLNEEPQPLARFNNAVTPELERVVFKALAKDRDERYQHIDDMLADLRRERKNLEYARTGYMRVSPTAEQPAKVIRPSKINLKYVVAAVVLAAAVVVIVLFNPFRDTAREGKGSSERKTIAVIPFENLGDPEREYFADGITDEITGRLSRLSGLGVIARSSAREYKKTTRTVRQIGDELGVEYVLMGTVRWSGGIEPRVRVNPELIHVKSALQIWSQAYDAPYSDAFEIQANVATEVANALNLELLQHEKENLKGKLTENPQAYDYYLKGREYQERSVARADYEIAIEQFERAIALDPSFAAAYAGLSRAHAGMYWFFYDRTKERVEKSRITAERAVALAPNLSDAHAALGWHHYHTRLDYEAAIKEFSIALQLDPNNPEVSYGMAAVLRRQGNMSESIKHWRKVLAVNPRASDMERQLGETLMLARRYEEADSHFANAIQLAPDISETYSERALNLILWKGDLAMAAQLVEEGKKYGRAEPGGDQPLSYLEYKIAIIRGDYEAAERTTNSEARPAGLDNQFQFYPTILLKAQSETLRGNSAKARTLFEQALESIEKKLRENPDDERAHSSLGIAYAGLGRKDDAVRAAKKGVEMLPVEKEAWRGSHRLTDLAIVYTMVGEYEKALDLLERLVSIPSEVSGHLLRLDPTWKPLRNHKRFQDLVKGTGA
jgi:TolB-like protein/Flp pilus assembly protein TadD/predicted Ser/Thr protein kinase